VSILDPRRVPQELEIPDHWKLVAYLCLGYAEDEQDQPELEREGWAARQLPENVLIQR
jgi:5,6-dimethylbenzimidazole synthase